MSDISVLERNEMNKNLKDLNCMTFLAIVKYRTCSYTLSRADSVAVAAVMVDGASHPE